MAGTPRFVRSEAVVTQVVDVDGEFLLLDSGGGEAAFKGLSVFAEGADGNTQVSLHMTPYVDEAVQEDISPRSQVLLLQPKVTLQENLAVDPGNNHQIGLYFQYQPNPITLNFSETTPPAPGEQYHFVFLVGSTESRYTYVVPSSGHASMEAFVEAVRIWLNDTSQRVLPYVEGNQPLTMYPSNVTAYSVIQTRNNSTRTYSLTTQDADKSLQGWTWARSGTILELVRLDLGDNDPEKMSGILKADYDPYEDIRDYLLNELAVVGQVVPVLPQHSIQVTVQKQAPGSAVDDGSLVLEHTPGSGMVNLLTEAIAPSSHLDAHGNRILPVGMRTRVQLKGTKGGATRLIVTANIARY